MKPTMTIKSTKYLESSNELATAYKEMCQDSDREQMAHEWCESLISAPSKTDEIMI